jgi:hypothetical protein
MTARDDEVSAKAAELIALLSDSEAYNKRLAELRGVAAAANSKLAEATAFREQHAQADRLLKDAQALLAKQAVREQELNNAEADLREHQQQSAAAAKAAAEQDARRRAEMAAEQREIAFLKERILAGQCALAEAKKHIDAEWLAVEEARRQVQDLHTLH